MTNRKIIERRILLLTKIFVGKSSSLQQENTGSESKATESARARGRKPVLKEENQEQSGRLEQKSPLSAKTRGAKESEAKDCPDRTSAISFKKKREVRKALLLREEKQLSEDRSLYHSIQWRLGGSVNRGDLASFNTSAKIL